MAADGCFRPVAPIHGWGHPRSHVLLHRFGFVHLQYKSGLWIWIRIQQLSSIRIWIRILIHKVIESGSNPDPDTDPDPQQVL
jgi:hypothetical protein